tara:strand:+ start:3648 stop:5030 length:1383 start_codon:yes stop_codon:yes gene_type:complete
MVNINIPLLFDISAGGIIYSEAVSTIDVFDSHLKFQLYGDSSAGLIDEFKKILYGDAAENDASGVLFYTSDSTDLATTLANIISSKILGENSKLIQPSLQTTDGSGNLIDNWWVKYKPPGIPLPNYSANFDALGRNNGPNPANNTGYDVTGQNYHTKGITDGTGTSFGRTLIRLLSTHLMGHPFAQGFLANESQIIRDISNANTGDQLKATLLKNNPDLYSAHGSGDAGKVDISSVNIVTTHASNSEYDIFEPTLKTKGIRNSLLQSLYAGLLASDTSRFDMSMNDVGLDISTNILTGGDDFDSGHPTIFDSSYNVPRRLPFRQGDTLSFYFRPRVKLDCDNNISDYTNVIAYGNPDLSGVGQGSHGFSSKKVQEMFYQPRHRWIAHQNATKVYQSSATAENLVSGNGYDTYAGAVGDTVPNVLMTGTDLHRDMTVDGGTLGTGNSTMFDGHVWRIKIQL